MKVKLKGSGNQVLKKIQQNFSGSLTVAHEVSCSIEGSNY